MGIRIKNKDKTQTEDELFCLVLVLVLDRAVFKPQNLFCFLNNTYSVQNVFGWHPFGHRVRLVYHDMPDGNDTSHSDAGCGETNGEFQTRRAQWKGSISLVLSYSLNSVPCSHSWCLCFFQCVCNSFLLVDLWPVSKDAAVSLISYFNSLAFISSHCKLGKDRCSATLHTHGKKKKYDTFYYFSIHALTSVRLS